MYALFLEQNGRARALHVGGDATLLRRASPTYHAAYVQGMALSVRRMDINDMPPVIPWHMLAMSAETIAGHRTGVWLERARQVGDDWVPMRHAA